MYGPFKSSWFSYYKNASIATLMVLLRCRFEFRCDVLPAKGSMESFPHDCQNATSVESVFTLTGMIIQ